jgi:hypothetical protein
MTTEFGTFAVRMNQGGTKYPAHIALATEDGKQIIRIMLSKEQAALYSKSITGVITFAEEINGGQPAIPAVLNAEGKVVKPEVPAIKGGSFGFRLISVDNVREHEIELARIVGNATKRLNAAKQDQVAYAFGNGQP